jgi:hypothetical protein
MRAGMAVRLMALRRAKSQLARVAKERRDRYRPFIVAVLRDSGLMRDQQEDGSIIHRSGQCDLH